MHEIETNDSVIATEQTWHRLETIVTPEQAKVFAGSPLDYTVGEEPIYTPDLRAITGYKRVFAPTLSGTETVTLQVARETYGTVQNRAVWEAVEQALYGVDYTVTCVGTLNDRRRGFFSLALADDQDYLTNGDQFKANINVLFGHDGATAISAIDSVTRVVCGNTFRYALAEKRQDKALAVTLRHTSQAATRVSGFGDAIERTLEKRAEFFTSLEYLQSVELTQEQAAQFVVGHTVGINPAEATARRTRPAQDILDAFVRGDGNRGETAYDLFNGYTQALTRKAVVSDEAKNAYSSEWGGGAQRKADAYAGLVDDRKREETIEKGRKLIAA